MEIGNCGPIFQFQEPFFGHIPDNAAVEQYNTIKYNTDTKTGEKKIQNKSRFTSVPVHGISLHNSYCAAVALFCAIRQELPDCYCCIV
jgi:hypothetical protein